MDLNQKSSRRTNSNAVNIDKDVNVNAIMAGLRYEDFDDSTI